MFDQYRLSVNGWGVGPSHVDCQVDFAIPVRDLKVVSSLAVFILDSICFMSEETSSATCRYFRDSSCWAGDPVYGDDDTALKTWARDVVRDGKKYKPKIYLLMDTLTFTNVSSNDRIKATLYAHTVDRVSGTTIAIESTDVPLAFKTKKSFYLNMP